MHRYYMLDTFCWLIHVSALYHPLFLLTRMMNFLIEIDVRIDWCTCHGYTPLFKNKSYGLWKKKWNLDMAVWAVQSNSWWDKEKSPIRTNLFSLWAIPFALSEFQKGERKFLDEWKTKENEDDGLHVSLSMVAISFVATTVTTTFTLQCTQFVTVGFLQQASFFL